MKSNFSKRADDNESAGGPGSLRSQPDDVRTEAALALEDAHFIEDLYVRGGAGKFIEARGSTLRDIARHKAAGVIDTQDNLRGGNPKVMLTARGLSLLAQAVKVIQSAPRMRGR